MADKYSTTQLSDKISTLRANFGTTIDKLTISNFELQESTLFKNDEQKNLFHFFSILSDSNILCLFRQITAIVSTEYSNDIDLVIKNYSAKINLNKTDLTTIYSLFLIKALCAKF